MVAGCASASQNSGVAPLSSGEVGSASSKDPLVFNGYQVRLSDLKESYNPLYAGQLANCSNDTYWCLSAGSSADSVMNIVVPKTCTNLYIGASWSTGVLTTKVIALATGSNDTYVLATEGFASVAFLYNHERGIVAVEKSVDGEAMIAAARSGNLRSVRPRDTSKGKLADGMWMLRCKRAS
jgi:hypothetical protein